MSSLLWVPVPAGRVRDGKAVLRVVVTPRLDGSLELAGMADWPAALGAAGTGIEVLVRASGATADTGTRVTASLRPLARSDVWQRFFGTIEVRPFARPAGYDPSVRKTSQDAAAVRKTYRKAAATVGAPATVRAELEGWRAPETAPRPTEERPEPPCDPPDFHRAVALLREHPAMLELLGLVLELELDTTGTGVPQGRHEVSARWAGSPVPVQHRWTRYEFDGTHFLPVSAGDIVSGLVDLSVNGRWKVITFDVDGGVAKLRQSARALAAADGTDDGSRPQLPTLRSAGLMLTRVGREAQLKARAARGRGGPVDDGAAVAEVLTAEDLVLGYRLDVRPQNSTTWFSLHRRDATYRIGDLPPFSVPDEEGHLKPHAVVRDEDGDHADEVVARWDGWSLSVARPVFDGRAGRVSRRSQRCPMPYDFEATYAVVKASLPTLRFGRSYQLRARVVDLSGGGLDREDGAAEGRPTALKTYARYEPVPPPQIGVPDGLLVPHATERGAFVLKPDVLGPGGSLERLVIRSAPAADGEFSTAEFDADPAYPANDSRLLAGPATTFDVADGHGALRLADELGFSRVSRAFGNRRSDVPALQVDPASVLPDPAALGVAAALLPEPGLLPDVVHDDRPWGGSWPDLAPKQIDLVPAAPGTLPALVWIAPEPGAADQDARRVEVRLAPGDHVVVELSSTIRSDDIDSFALNKVIGGEDDDEDDDEPDDADGTQAQDDIAAGRHPMLEPARRIELVHAVRKPLGTPTGAATAERPAGATYVDYVPTSDDPLLGVHTQSTGQLDLIASWQEWGDAPQPRSATAPVPSVPITRGAAALPVLRQEFGDTKHRVVDLDLAAVSRYRDCFAGPADDSAFTTTGKLTRISVLSSARPATPVPAATVPAFAWSEVREPGRLVRTRGGGRLRIELGRPWFTTGEGEALGVVVWPGAESAIPEPLRDMVSRLNRDPIHPTPSPPAFAAEQMFTGAGEAVSLSLPGLEGVVRVLPYEVFSDGERWYADIAVPGAVTQSYAPFARLSLVRYQPASIVGRTPADDLRVSHAARTDMVPLLPDRTLDVRQDAAGVHVTLSGVTRQGPRPNRVVATLERAAAPGAAFRALTLAPPPIPVWVRVAEVTGTTNAPLPAPLPPGGGALRLVVREVEDLIVAASATAVEAARLLTERTVYLDTVELPL